MTTSVAPVSGPTVTGGAEQAATTAPSGRSRWQARTATGTAEAVAAVGAALGSVQLSRSIVVDPTDRIGQVSGLAGLDLRFLVLGLLLVVACVIATRSRSAFPVVSGVSCAAVAGLASGLVAGGVLLALRGTDWPLFANWGDSGQLIRWADDILAGRPIPGEYPPVFLHAIALWADLTGGSTAVALRTAQVVGTALFGPAAYLAWRLVLTPVWALAVALVAAMPLIEPYKPYTTVVLVVFVPVLIAFLRVLRRAAELGRTRIVLLGLGTGAVLGALICVYSGWFVWSAPGALVAVLVLFPWRAAALRGLALLGLAAVGFAAAAGSYLTGLLAAAGTEQDRYFFFDTRTEPAYIAMWRGDLPGDVGPWPPLGELGGVGVFTVLLVVGLGVAVAVAGRRTAVLVACALLAGAWLMRFWLASQMYATQSVQLYPRTTPEILFCLLLLAVLATLHSGDRLQEAWRARAVADESGRPRPAATVGALCAALLLALSMGSATADEYLPRHDRSVGLLAYVAQHVRQPDGTCPDYTAEQGCAPDPGALLRGEWRPTG